MKLTSVACRGCCWGTWGENPAKICPYCKQPVHETGTVKVIPLTKG